MKNNVINVVAALIRDEGAVMPRAEIDQVVWVDPSAPPDLPLAPLTRDHVLPLAGIGSS
jgi:hypothetical protein